MTETKKTKNKVMLSAFSIILILIFALGVLSYILPIAKFSGDTIINGSGVVRAKLSDILMSPILGFENAIDVCIFVIILGGFLAIVTKTGALETGIKVTKIAAILRNSEDVYYPGFWRVGDMTESALKSWAVKDTIMYYLGRDMEYAPTTYNQYKEWFENKEWNGFSEEQIVIEGDTVYFCGN